MLGPGGTKWKTPKFQQAPTAETVLFCHCLNHECTKSHDEKLYEMSAAGTKDTIAKMSMFHMTIMDGQVKVIAVETQSRPLGLGWSALEGDVPEKVHNEEADVKMVPEVIHGEAIEDHAKDNPPEGPDYKPTEVQEMSSTISAVQQMQIHHRTSQT